MTTTETEQTDVRREVTILNGIADLVPVEVEKDFPLPSPLCILATRVGYEVCKHFGVKARPQSVHVNISNRQMVKLVKQYGRTPRDAEEAARWVKRGAWSMGVIAEDRWPGRYEGHLVLVAMDSVLIDASLHKLSRPQRDINLEPFVATLPDMWSEGEPLLAVMDGTLLDYRKRDNREWADAADWYDAERRHYIVKRVIAGIELKLAALDA